jgi:hypothetical protein
MRMSYNDLKIIILLFSQTIGLGNQPLVAQDTISTKNKDENFWLYAGLGSNSISRDLSLASFGVTYRNMKSIFSIRCTGNLGTGEFTFPQESFFDLGALYGRIKKGYWGNVSFSTGVSYLKGVYRGEYLGGNGHNQSYKGVPYSTVGIPFEGHLLFTPFFFLGIGANVIANLNPGKSYAGFLISVQIGKVR